MMQFINYREFSKFWEILTRKTCHISNLYVTESERDVFVRRVSRLLKKGRIVLNTEQTSKEWYVDGKPLKTRVSEVRHFMGISHVNSWHGSKIKLRFADIASSGVMMGYEELLYMQYKYLTADENELYDKYLKMMYEPTEKEKVVYIHQGTDAKEVKKIMAKYNLGGNISAKSLTYLSKLNDLYIPMGNTGRFSGITYAKDPMFLIINQKDYNEKETSKKNI